MITGIFNNSVPREVGRGLYLIGFKGPLSFSSTFQADAKRRAMGVVSGAWSTSCEAIDSKVALQGCQGIFQFSVVVPVKYLALNCQSNIYLPAC